MFRLLLSTLLLAAWLPAFALFEVTDKDVQNILNELDHSLERRELYIKQRQSEIDKLTAQLDSSASNVALLLNIAERYTGFNNDSALHYFGLGLRLNNELPFELGTAKLLPLSGFFSPAIEIYDSINPSDVPSELQADYYDSGRQMYSYMAAFSAGDAKYKSEYNARALNLQQKLLEVLPKESIEYKFNLGEYYFLLNERGKSRALLEYVVEHTDNNNNLKARAAHHLSSMAKDEGNTNSYIYYLGCSALADLSSATREVASLQELGNHLYTMGDLNRSYTYLTEALANAVECGAPLRMIESSRSLPIIERAKTEQIEQQRQYIYIIMGVLIIVVVSLIITMMRLNREMKRMQRLQENLRSANRVKEVYISQFLTLCSIYMDKLNQFCKIANRKIAAGKVDDLFRLTKSGKFVEEQSKEFYEVFDNAFLHIYPNFVEQVNTLLRDDSKIELKEGETLNTDLRILAFMRLGIEESSRIAQVLNYSLNTIYAYRNRTKARAINRDTFEADIMKIKPEY